MYTNDLMRAMQSNGSDVLLITQNQSQFGTAPDPSIIYVNPMNVPGLKTTSFMLRANRKLKQLKDDFDIVHYTNDYCGFGMSRQQIGRSVLATIHHTHSLEASSVSPYIDRGFVTSIRFSIAESLLRKMERSTLKNADMVVAVSRFTAENALSIYPFLKDKLRIVLNAVDEVRFNPNIASVELRARLGLEKNPIILYVGRLAASKGLKFLIEALKEVVAIIPNSKLLLIGTGSNEAEQSIISLIHKLDLETSVVLLGAVSAEDLPKAYSASDVVVLPSLVEGFGLVLLEGMASGKPVVATKLGPTEEIISDGVEGRLVPRADSHLLASGIISILTDASIATKMGRAGRKKVEERFALKNWADHMAAIYQELLSRK